MNEPRPRAQPVQPNAAAATAIQRPRAQPVQPNAAELRICPRCSAAFIPGRPAQQSFCSARCRLQANADRQRFRQTVGLMIQLGEP